MNQQLRNLEDLFWKAKNLDPGQPRQAFVQGIQKEDADVAVQLKKLLADDARSDQVFGGLSELDCPSALSETHDSVAPADASPSSLSSLRSGSIIGPYKLLEPIGEGGMGLVYLAQQSEPVRRKVALKIIKPGMDSRQVVARFEAERQALAMMDHPNIAKVLDAGATETGLPYFVMELVRGIPMTEYCDRAKMTTRDRLELFINACSAIQHAHNKGVIHRDIKPSNILVTEQDGTPLVKVIDFGIAKALTDNLTDKTMFTGMFQMMGTPLYMSPEQASLSNVDVDVRSDVYSLGVMLYELLSGTLPIDRVTADQLSFEELRQRICDTEPPRPSKRLSTLKNERETIADRRGIDVSRFRQLVSSELDWIVMRALEKDRNRRYQSAREFAEDIQRFLDGDAVEACPPTTIYKLQKLYRKNRIAVLFTLSLCVSMVAAVVGTSLQAVRAMQAEKLAESRLQAIQRGQDEIRLALLSTEVQRDKANENYKRARAAVKQLLAHVATQEIAAIPEMNNVRRKLLADAAGFYTKLIEMNPQDSRNFAERASVNIKLERFRFVRPDLETAIELDPRNTGYHHALAFFFQNCPDEAYRGERTVVLKHAMAAAEIGPATHHHHANLAQIFKWRFQNNVKAEQHLREAAKLAGHKHPIAKLKYLIKADRFAGKHEEIVKRASEVDAESDDAQFIFHLIAESHLALGQFEEAVVMETKALESARRRFADQANHYAHHLLSGRGNANMKLGQYEKSLQDYEAAIAITPYLSSNYKRKALLLYLLGRKGSVIDVLRQSFELNPDDLSCFYWLFPHLFVRNPDSEFANEYLDFVTEGVSQARSNGSVDHLAALLYWRSRLFLTLGDGKSAHADRIELGPLIGELKDSEITADRLVELDQLIHEQMRNPDHPTPLEASLGKGDALLIVEPIAGSKMESEAK